jgi:hypothetical protein|tara:strand:- start:234 stop:524 length:291 start_codon:yes stop_codon:yes gene_type:complete
LGGIKLPRKKKKEKQVEELQTLSGWKIGDLAWAVTLGDTKPTQLEITHFHPDDMIAPAVTGTCLLTGKSRTVAVGWCEDNRFAAKKSFEKRKAKSC